MATAEPTHADDADPGPGPGPEPDRGPGSRIRLPAHATDDPADDGLTDDEPREPVTPESRTRSPRDVGVQDTGVRDAGPTYPPQGLRPAPPRRLRHRRGGPPARRLVSHLREQWRRPRGAGRLGGVRRTAPGLGVQPRLVRRYAPGVVQRGVAVSDVGPRRPYDDDDRRDDLGGPADDDSHPQPCDTAAAGAAFAGVFALICNAVSGRVTYGLGMVFGLAAAAVVFCWPYRWRYKRWAKALCAAPLAALATASRRWPDCSWAWSRSPSSSRSAARRGVRARYRADRRRRALGLAVPLLRHPADVLRLGLAAADLRRAGLRARSQGVEDGPDHGGGGTDSPCSSCG